MAGQPGIHALVICLRRARHERQAAGAQTADRLENIVGAAGDVLNALALIGVQIFLDLAVRVGGFVQRNTDAAIRAGQRAW